MLPPSRRQLFPFLWYLVRVRLVSGYKMSDPDSRSIVCTLPATALRGSPRMAPPTAVPWAQSQLRASKMAPHALYGRNYFLGRVAPEAPGESYVICPDRAQSM